MIKGPASFGVRPNFFAVLVKLALDASAANLFAVSRAQFSITLFSLVKNIVSYLLKDFRL